MNTDGVSITFVLRKELADRLPTDSAELQAFINKAIEYKLNAVNFSRIGGKIKSPSRAAASRENGRKGGRPRKDKNPAM